MPAGIRRYRNDTAPGEWGEASGAPAGLAVARQDLLDRTLAALDEAKEWGNIAMWEVDLATNHTYWSTQLFEMTGLDEASLSGFAECVHPDDRHLVDHISARVGEQAGPYRLEHRIIRSGEIRHLGHRLQSIADADGTPVRVIGMVVDITRLQQVEDQLSSAVSARNVGLLASAHVHSFKNQLAVILGHAGLVAAAMERGELPERESIDAITRAATSGHDLVRDILDLGRVDDAVVPVDPAKFVDRIVALSRAIVGSSVEITVDVEATRRFIAQPRRLEQAILDLVMNASDAMGDRGRLAIAWAQAGADRTGPSSSGSMGEISISDSGVGMDAKTLARVGEPFFTTKAEGKGSGIGLTSARLVAEHCGGTLEVDSTLGCGTTVRIWLPLEPAGDREARPNGRPKATRIVVVADDHGGRAIAAALQQPRRQVVTVSSLGDAERHVATEPVDAIVIVGSDDVHRAVQSTVPVVRVAEVADPEHVRRLVQRSIDRAD